MLEGTQFHNFSTYCGVIFGEYPLPKFQSSLFHLQRLVMPAKLAKQVAQVVHCAACNAIKTCFAQHRETSKTKWNSETYLRVIRVQQLQPLLKHLLQQG